MKIKSLYVGLMAFAMLLVGASCSDDNTPSYSKNTVQNTELKNILIQKGYQFNENGNLLLDDLANTTTTLDLSGTKLSVDALAELTMFPNLKEVNLSNNGYGPAFDFAKLPEQITGVDLTGNEIYDYDGLVETSIVNDELQANILHNLTKLYLPTTAKWNVEDLMPFYTENQSSGAVVDMQMVDVNGNLQAYTTLRDVPDEDLRNYLYKQFSQLFTDDKQIDISGHLDMYQAANPIVIAEYQELETVTSLEGIEYIIHNPYWTAANVNIQPLDEVALPRLVIPSTLTLLNLANVDVANGLDLSGATNVYYYSFHNIKNLVSLDLTPNLIWGQRGYDAESDQLTGSSLYVMDCPDLVEIKLPEESYGACAIGLEVLPKLETFDMSNMSMITNLRIGDLSGEFDLQYPNLTEFRGGARKNKTTFACSKTTFDRDVTKEFCNKYYKNSDTKYLSTSTYLGCSKNTGYSWYRNL